MAGLSSRAKSTISYGFAVHLSVGFLVAFIISMVHVEKAQADARAKLVKAYDESVDAWLAGDGETYARKWTGEEALPLPSVVVEREDPTRPQFSVAFGVLQSGPEATGSLPDDEPDYKRYDEGTMLVAILEGFHDESFHTGVEDVVFTVGDSSVPVKAMTCVVNEYCNSPTEENAEDSDSDERGCRFTISHSFLQSVRLVDLTGDADAFVGVEARASTCALEYYTNHGTGDWFASRDAAIQECAVASATYIAPNVRRDVRVSIRSPRDPFVTAMELTRDSNYGLCSGDFGTTPEEHRKVALDAGIAAGVLGPAAAAAWAAGTHFLRKQDAERSGEPTKVKTDVKKRARQYSKETPAMAPVSAAVAQQPPSAYGGMPANSAMPQPHGPPAAYGGQSAPATYTTRSTFASIFGRGVQTR
jgi:hypothetical protein